MEHLNSTIVGHDAGCPGLSPEKDAACCLRLLMENLESAMALPENEALERLGVIKKATETIIAKRLGLDRGCEYSTLRSEDFAAACNSQNGAEELKFAQLILNGDLTETIELPAHQFVYLADQDRLITTPVDIEVINLVKSTGLLKVKAELDSLRSGKGHGFLVNVIRAINAVDIQSLATESESLAIAAAEGVMRCLSSNLAFDSIPNLRTPDGIKTLGNQVRKGRPQAIL